MISIFFTHCRMTKRLAIFSPLPPGEVGTPLGVTGEGELTISITYFKTINFYHYLALFFNDLLPKNMNFLLALTRRA